VEAAKGMTKGGTDLCYEQVGAGPECMGGMAVHTAALGIAVCCGGQQLTGQHRWQLGCCSS